MRTLLTSLLGLSLAIAPTACGGTKTDNGTGSAGSAVVATGSGSAAAPVVVDAAIATAPTGAGSGAGSGSSDASAVAAGSGVTDQPMSHKAGMCPSTVLGSTTKADLKDGKILVAITGSDKESIAAVQKRAEQLLKEKADNLAAGTTSSGHDQKGTHGGGLGLCPVYVPEGASAVAANTATGVVVTITPSKTDKPAEFKATVDARIARAADWVKTNVKAGAGNEGGVGGAAGPEHANHTGKGDGKGKERQAAGSAAK